MQSRSLLIKVQSDKRCQFNIAKSCIINTPFIINIYCGIILFRGGPMYVDNQNFAAVLEHDFMRHWFVALQCKMTCNFIIHSLWHKFVEKVKSWNPQSLVLLEPWFFDILFFYFLSKTWEHLDVIFDIHCMLMTVNLPLYNINIYLCVTVIKRLTS